jgi:hypothetical protein
MLGRRIGLHQAHTPRPAPAEGQSIPVADVYRASRWRPRDVRRKRLQAAYTAARILPAPACRTGITLPTDRTFFNRSRLPRTPSLERGQRLGAKRVPKQQQLWPIRLRLGQHRRLRDRALLVVAVPLRTAMTRRSRAAGSIFPPSTLLTHQSSLPVQRCRQRNAMLGTGPLPSRLLSLLSEPTGYASVARAGR